MKTIATYSAQYKIISEQPTQLRNQNHPNPQSFAPKSNKKKLTKDRQEFMNNISASGFKQFHA